VTIFVNCALFKCQFIIIIIIIIILYKAVFNCSNANLCPQDLSM